VRPVRVACNIIIALAEPTDGNRWAPYSLRLGHVNCFAALIAELLKGKSCFHIMKLTPELPGQIKSALQIGFKAYRARGWV
jgi:hypothetical protein